MAKRLEVVVVGCGTPKFSMGWTHLFQLLQEPLASMVDVVGVVEPFFLSEQGKDAKGADLFRAWTAEHPSIKFVADCPSLPPVTAGKVRIGVVAVRTTDSKRIFEELVLGAGCRAVYLEKPGATSVAELDAMRKVAVEKGVTIVVGYSRNLGYPKLGLAYAKEQHAVGARLPRITLLHSNPWSDAELATCFERCAPGMMYDMACHDLAVAAAYFGLTTEFTDLTIDNERSVQATRGGITDFVRLAFTVTPKVGEEPISFLVDRCTGAFNGMEVETLDGTSASRRFMSGDKPLLFENPLDDLSPHLAVQYDYYVEAKRVLFQALLSSSSQGSFPDGQIELPIGVPTLEVARNVMLLADKLTEDFKAKVAFEVVDAA